MSVKPWKPTKEQLLAARDKGVRDVIAPNLKVTTPPDIALAEYLLRASGVLVDE